MPTTRIHVNQHEIRANLKDGDDRPVITAKDSAVNHYGHEAAITCPSCGEVAALVVNPPGSPLSCGARVWVETKGKVVVYARMAAHDPKSYEEVGIVGLNASERRKRAEEGQP